MLDKLIEEGALIPIVAIICTTLAPMLIYSFGRWQRNRRVELELALKAEMVSRGLSADEIERVLRATAADRNA
jgi:Flp pilus assembly protein TadB